MKITVLGCGASLGTPGAGGFWGRCDPEESKNHRTRASLMVQSKTTDLLIDTTYDLRLHLNAHKQQKLDGVLISHGHNDHVNGIDDLRAVAYHAGELVDIYSNEETLDEIHRRWPYLFETLFDGLYVQFLQKKPVDNYGKFTIGDIEVETFEQDHTTCNSLGFRFGDFAYSIDVASLPEKSLEALKGIETWIVDAAGYQRESISTHANLQRVMEWTDILKPKMTYITCLTTHMDYKTLCDELPPHIRPCWDGMVIEMGSNQR